MSPMAGRLCLNKRPPSVSGPVRECGNPRRLAMPKGSPILLTVLPVPEKGVNPPKVPAACSPDVKGTAGATGAVVPVPVPGKVTGTGSGVPIGVLIIPVLEAEGIVEMVVSAGMIAYLNYFGW